MSKKRAADYTLSFVGPPRKGYVQIGFLDKKRRTMMSSVDVVLNSAYLTDGADGWNYDLLWGFVRSR